MCVTPVNRICIQLLTFRQPNINTGLPGNGEPRVIGVEGQICDCLIEDFEFPSLRPLELGD